MTETEAYQALKKLVDNGDLSITHIDAPPRTASSAFYAGLTNVHDIGLYQPHLKNQDRYFGHLLEKYQEKEWAHKPVTMVIKDLATSLTPEEWERMMSLTDKLVVVLRDPHLQLESLFRIRANTLKGGLSAPDHIGTKETWEMIDEIEKLYKHDTRGDYFLTDWQSMSEHLIRFDSYAKQHPDKKLTVVDGFLLRADPYGVMAEVLDSLRIPYDNNTLDKVVQDWHPEAARTISEGARATASVAKVVNSKGYTPPLEPPPSFGQFPDGVQEHLTDLAIPTYIDFLRWPQRIGPKTLEDLEIILSKKCSEFSIAPQERQSLADRFSKPLADISLEEINPVSAYALVSTLDKTGLNKSQLRAIDHKLSQLRTQFAAHAATFDIIDHVISGQDKPKDTLTITHIDEGRQLTKGRRI